MSLAIYWTRISAFTSAKRDRMRFCADSGSSVQEKPCSRSLPTGTALRSREEPAANGGA